MAVSKKTKAAGPKSERSLGTILAELRAIGEWFDERDEVDIEEGIAKVKEGAALVKVGRAKLAELENVFEEVEQELNESE